MEERENILYHWSRISGLDNNRFYPINGAILSGSRELFDHLLPKYPNNRLEVPAYFAAISGDSCFLKKIIARITLDELSKLMIKEIEVPDTATYGNTPDSRTYINDLIVTNGYEYKLGGSRCPNVFRCYKQPLIVHAIRHNRIENIKLLASSPSHLAVPHEGYALGLAILLDNPEAVHLLKTVSSTVKTEELVSWTYRKNRYYNTHIDNNEIVEKEEIADLYLKLVETKKEDLLISLFSHEEQSSIVNTFLRYKENTPLILASKHNLFNLVSSLAANSDVKIDLTDDMSRTALHWAANEGSYESVVRLVTLGASDQIQSKDGFTPKESAQFRLKQELEKPVSDQDKDLVENLEKIINYFS